MWTANESRLPAHTRAAILVAHPGHELRIFNWIEKHRPVYCCLTDGSGGSGASRTSSSLRLLRSLDIQTGPIFGRYRDREIYQFLLAGRVEIFVAMVEELADFWQTAGIECVVGDAIEGINPVHDVCRFMVDGAVERLTRRTGRAIVNRDFALDDVPDACPSALLEDALWLRLDEAALERKVTAALAYPELRFEVSQALQRFGRDAFAMECLRPSTGDLMTKRFEIERPQYESWGRMRVSAGIYDEIIRYRQHVLPICAAIREAARS
jgi:hypothetical protein